MKIPHFFQAIRKICPIMAALIFMWPETFYGQSAVTIILSHDTINHKPAGGMICGNFIELGFAHQIDGLRNQKLWNSSFEEVRPCSDPVWGWLGKKPGADLSSEKWWHSGYEENQWYVFPSDRLSGLIFNRCWGFHHGLQAAALSNKHSEGRMWLAQDGVYLDPAVPARFMGYFSNNTSDPSPKPVGIVIGIYKEKDFNCPLYESDLIVPDGNWMESNIIIPPLGYRGRLTFAVSLGPGSTAAFDGFSLMPLDSCHGWRPQAVEALKRISVPIIRFPGGCFASFYDWQDGIGPRIDRKPVVPEYWGGLEENQAGTAEFVQLCTMTGSQPFLCVNMLTKTDSHAAAWVQYCNGKASTVMGALRVSHGFQEPFRVRYWELDNETYRRYGWEEYARKCVEYSKAMKAEDPDIKLVMVGYWMFNKNLDGMLEIAGKYIDLVTDRAIDEADLRKDLDIINKYNKDNGTDIRLCNTEWLAPAGFDKHTLDALNYMKPPENMSLQEHQISWNYAMNTACQVMLFQRLGGDFMFANFNNMANTWGQNIIECTRDTVFISAAGRVFELMSRSSVAYVMGTITDPADPGLHIQAGIDESGKELTVCTVNYNKEEREIRIDPGTWAISGKSARMSIVSAAGPMSSNTVLHPGDIKSTVRSVSVRNMRKPAFTIPAWSVCEIRLAL